MDLKPEAVSTDASAKVTDAELPWAERIKQLYDVGDGSDARVAEVFDAIQRIEGELANAEIADMHFEAGRGALAPVGASEWTMASGGAIDRRARTHAGDTER